MGGGLRGASICLVYCEAGGSWGRSSCWQVCNGLCAHPPVCVPWVLTQRGWQLTARAHGSLRVTAHPGQSPLTDASPCPSHPIPCPLLWPGPSPFVTPPMDHFEKPVYCAAPRHNTLHRSNLYIWQIKLDIIVILVLWSLLGAPKPELFSPSRTQRPSQAHPAGFRCHQARVQGLDPWLGLGIWAGKDLRIQEPPVSLTTQGP